MGNDSDDDMELQRLRMQRMQALMKAKADAVQKSQQKVPTLNDKIDRILPVILTPDAFQYLNQIKTNNNTLYNQIRNELFPPEITSQIDLLIQYLQRGMIRSGVITITEIQYLERQLLGIESTITIKKQGHDATSLGSFLKDEE